MFTRLDYLIRFKMNSGRRSITQNFALIASRSSGIPPQSTKVGSFDRGDSPRSNEPTYAVWDAIPDERDAIKTKFCVIDSTAILADLSTFGASSS